MTQVHSGLMRFAELDAFVDGVLSGGPLEQKLQVGVVGTQGANGRSWEHPEGLKHVRQRMKHVETMIWYDFTNDNMLNNDMILPSTIGIRYDSIIYVCHHGEFANIEMHLAKKNCQF